MFRSQALALGMGSFLFLTFPLIRPWFPLDPTAPYVTLDQAGSVVSSPQWLVSHLVLLIAFIALGFGLFSIYSRYVDTEYEKTARNGLIASVIGIALILPMLGVELFLLPLVGSLYSSGIREVARAIPETYNGLASLICIIGLILLALGAVLLGRAMWRDTLPRWAIVTFILGLVFWLPALPQIIRTIDGIFIGIGGIVLAWVIVQSDNTRASIAARE